MSSRRLMSLLCIVPLTLFVCTETSYGQVCEGVAPSVATPTFNSSGAQQGVSITGNPLINLMRLSQLASGQSQQFQRQQQQMMFMRQQWMLQQHEQAKKRAAEKAKKEEEKEKQEELAKREEKKEEKVERPDDGLTSDQRIRLSLLKLERKSGLTSKTSKKR